MKRLFVALLALVCLPVSASAGVYFGTFDIEVHQIESSLDGTCFDCGKGTVSFALDTADPTQQFFSVTFENGWGFPAFPFDAYKAWPGWTILTDTTEFSPTDGFEGLVMLEKGINGIDLFYTHLDVSGGYMGVVTSGASSSRNVYFTAIPKSLSYSRTPVPAPSAWLFMIFGLFGIGLAAKRKPRAVSGARSIL